MEIEVTLNMLPDLLAFAALLTLAIYHLMLYWGRRRDREEIYNFYFAVFVLSTAFLLLTPYFLPQYFLYWLKPRWLQVANIEMFTTWLLFISGIKFLNHLLGVPRDFRKNFYVTYIVVTLDVLLTFTSNTFGYDFYASYVLKYVLVSLAINILFVYFIYGRWIYRQKLFKDNFVRLFYFGFVLLVTNIFVYRAIELMHVPRVLIPNHYLTAFILYVFAYALTIKFNREHHELKELKVSLERKVEERTEELKRSNQLLENQNNEIEEQKQEIILINKQLEARAEELKELDLVKSRFFTNISHEFRTPLTLIIGPLETLSKKTDDREVITEYGMMLRQAKKLLMLINQLLELSKLQKNMLELKVSKQDLSRLIRTIVSAFTSFARELNSEIRYTERVTISEFWFDKDKVEKVVNNLITNALKFTPREGRVDVLLKNSPNGSGSVEISVKDTGTGIEEEDLKHIFDPFYQADSLANRRFEGTGIGLALVKELVQLHKGSIRVNSQKDKGSEFIVELPVSKSLYQDNEIATEEVLPADDFYFQETEKTSGQEATNELPKEKTRILLIEDNPDMRHYIRSNLVKKFRITEASDGMEGISKARALIPDLIVADVMMPRMNGLEMTRVLKNDERTSHIPIIILTAKASDESKIEGLQTQADDYVTKPFNVEELTLRIRNLIANRKMMREKFTKSFEVNPSEITTSTIDERFLQKALQIVEKNMDVSDFGSEQFCSEITMSRTHVHRKLKALTGQSTTQFIRSIRLKRAVQLLRQNAGSVSEIAYQTGFSNLSYFTRCFREVYGESPSEYMNQLS